MISELFENIKVYGRYVRKNKLDGLEYWERVKLFLKRPEQQVGLEELNKIIGSDWTISVNLGQDKKSSDLNEIYDFVHGDGVEQLQIFGEAGDEEQKSLEHKVWEQNHFFLQLIRIPKNNKLDLIRLLQIAYNLGQLSVCLNTKNFSSDSIEYFESNKLDDINSYIDLTSKKNEQIDTNVQITDLINNTIGYIVEQMNLIQSGGSNIEPFYLNNIDTVTKTNTDYRRVIYTGFNQQFVLMSIEPGDDIKMEIHENHDQFLRIEKGEGIAIISGVKYTLADDTVVIIPAGSSHQIINTSKTEPLKLYTIYSPPEHPNKLVQQLNPDKLVEESNPDKLVQQLNPDKLVEESNPNKFKNKYLYYKNKYIKLKKMLNNN
jgi:mannose-6-phosphate isomerase-like protein (cupin superfamily)